MQVKKKDQLAIVYNFVAEQRAVQLQYMWVSYFSAQLLSLLSARYLGSRFPRLFSKRTERK